jgi:hypothetical protein
LGVVGKEIDFLAVDVMGNRRVQVEAHVLQA